MNQCEKINAFITIKTEAENKDFYHEQTQDILSQIVCSFAPLAVDSF